LQENKDILKKINRQVRETLGLLEKKTESSEANGKQGKAAAVSENN